MCTPSNRILYKVYTWDRNLNESKQINTWSAEIKSILCEHNLAYIFDQNHIIPLKQTIMKLKTSMYEKQQQILKIECES